MRDLNEFVKRCTAELDALGIRYGRVTAFKINDRAMRWGLCMKVRDGFEIQINKLFLDEQNDEKGLLSTLMHELLHTCPGCFNHGPEWERLAEKVHRAYGYRITRTSSPEEKGLSAAVIEKRIGEARYVIVCSSCGATLYRSRKSDVTERPDRYRCGACLGRLTVQKTA